MVRPLSLIAPIAAFETSIKRDVIAGAGQIAAEQAAHSSAAAQNGDLHAISSLDHGSGQRLGAA